MRLTDGAWDHALPGHQVVVQPLQASVQRVGDAALVVVQGGVDGLGAQRAAQRLLEQAQVTLEPLCFLSAASLRPRLINLSEPSSEGRVLLGLNSARPPG